MTPRMLRSRSGFVLLAVASLLVSAPGIALAHAELEATVPADGATVVGTPTELSATFSGALTTESTLSIRDSAGNRLAVGGLDPTDTERLVITPVPDLAPGTYELRWTAFSDDEHNELARGTSTFVVESPPATASPTAVATGEPSDTPTTAPTVEPTAPAPTAAPSVVDGDPAAGAGDVLLPIVAALAIVALGGAALLGRRRRPGPPG